MRSLWKGIWHPQRGHSSQVENTELVTSRKEAYFRAVALSSVAFTEKWAKDVQTD